MQLFLEEVKKVMFDQKACLLTGMTILFGIFMLVTFDKPYNIEMEHNKKAYLIYLEKVQGKLDDRKIKFIEDEAVIIVHAEEALDLLYKQYYQNEITKSVFEEKESQLLKVLENKEGYELVNQSYLYAVENPENRFLLYSNGWNGLFNSDVLEWISLVGLLLIVSNIICYDFDNGMKALNKSSYGGNISWQNNVNYKICILVLITIFYWFFTTFLQYLFFDLKYGLEAGTYPIQSIELFKNSSKQIQLFNAYLIIAMIKLVGYLLFGFLIMFVVTITENRVFTVFLAIILILIPSIGISESHLYKFFPVGLLLGDGYLKGDAYLTNMYTYEKTQTFQEFTSQQIVWTLLMAFALIIVFTRFTKNNHRNKHCHKKIKSFKGTIGMVVVVMFVLTGCTTLPLSEDITYNYTQRHEYFNGDYKYYASADRSGIYREDLKSGRIEKVDRSPFDAYVLKTDVVFGAGNCLYYSRYNIEDSPYFRNAFLTGAVWYNYQIVEIQLDNWEEKVIFEAVMNARQDTLLKRDSNSKWDFLRRVSAFFLNENDLFFITSDGLWCVDRVTNKVEQIENIDSTYNIAFDGKAIFYIGERYALKKYEVISKQVSDCNGIITCDFELKKGQIDYKNMKHHDSEEVYLLEDS